MSDFRSNCVLKGDTAMASGKSGGSKGELIGWSRTSGRDLPADDELLRAAQADPGEFAALYERYRDPVYAYLRTRTATAEDAADLVQQVFLQALRSLGRVDDAERFRAWLFRIARNAAIDSHRRRRISVDLDLVPQLDQHPDRSNPEDVAVRHEHMRELLAAIGTLDPGKRELLALRYAGGLRIPRSRP